MDKILMRPLFRDQYLNKQKQQMKKLKTGGLASIKGYVRGGEIISDEQSKALIAAPIIGSLLQGRKTQGDDLASLFSGTLSDIGRGVSQTPGVALNIAKIRATGAKKSMTTKPVLDTTTGKRRFATNQEIINSQGLLVPIDPSSDIAKQIAILDYRDKKKMEAEKRKAKAEKLSVAEEGLGAATDMVKQGAQIFANIDKGAFTGNFANAATGISGLIGGSKVLFDRVLNQAAETDPEFDSSVSNIENALQNKFGKGFGALEQQNKSNLTGLVYTILQIQEPGGRYSDQDARRVLEQLGDSSSPELFKVGLNTTLGNVIEKAISRWEKKKKKNRNDLKGGAYDSLLVFTEGVKKQEEKENQGKGKGAEIPESSIDFIKKRKKFNEPKIPALKGQ